MTGWPWFGAVLAVLLGGLVLSQTRKIDAPFTPNALLYFVADTQRELTRLPMAYTRIPDAEEIRIGDRIARLNQSKLDDEDEIFIQTYVQKVGNALAANAHRKLPYQFHYIPQRYFVNAFALPGGHVFIGAGLIGLMENEDELAAVLGHEIEHIDHFHCAERLQVEAALRKVPLGGLAEIPFELFQAGYNKDQEFEADREGTRLAVKAGYSPEGAIQLFMRFQKLEEQLEAKAKNPGVEVSSAAIQVLTGYFRSHPPSIDRIAQIRSLISQENWGPVSLRPLQPKYIFLAYEAQSEIERQHYDQALKKAAASVALHPGYAPALTALAKAKVATRDFQGASAAYKELLADHHLVEADLVRTFTAELIDAAIRAKHFPEAAQLAAFSLELQPNNPGTLQLLARTYLETGDLKAALETGEQLRRLYPGAAWQLTQQVTTTAQQALSAHDYERAARFSSFAVRLDPAHWETQELLARSQFARGDFVAAAEAYRTLIAGQIKNGKFLDLATIREYADALGSLPGHAEAAREFERVLAPLAADRSSSLRVPVLIEIAGLRVIAGDESKARAFLDPSPAPGAESFAPEHVARLGWWYYRAGKFDAGNELVRRFLLRRPGDAGLQHTLAWLALEQNSSSEALSLFETSPASDESAGHLFAGQTIARWQLHKTDEAMSGYEHLAKAAPEWTNPEWVRALYGPAVARSMHDMAVEEQRRVTARTGKMRH